MEQVVDPNAAWIGWGLVLTFNFLLTIIGTWLIVRKRREEWSPVSGGKCRQNHGRRESS